MIKLSQLKTIVFLLYCAICSASEAPQQPAKTELAPSSPLHETGIMDLIETGAKEDPFIHQLLLQKLFNDPTATQPLSQEQKESVQAFFGGKLICVIRHAQTDYNKNDPHICGSRTDIHLNSEGDREAARLGATLRPIFSEGDTCFVAPLLRTNETMQIALDALQLRTKVLVQQTPGLLEIDWGVLEGLPRPSDKATWEEEVDRKYGKLVFGEKNPIPGAEALHEAGERLVKAMVEIGSSTDQPIIVAISSGRVIKCANLALGVTSPPSMENCDKCIYLFDPSGKLKFLGHVALENNPSCPS